MIELIKESILFNCEARIEMDEKAMYVPVGNGTEVGLIKFLQDAEVPVHNIIKRKIGKILATIPFSPIRKRSVIALSLPDTDVVRVYFKGAPEFLINKCVKTFEVDGSKTHLTEE
jgi:magnesium-transporting ATPase (P-type)